MTFRCIARTFSTFGLESELVTQPAGKAGTGTSGVCARMFVSVSLYVFNKKLRYREEHSASVVLSWRTLKFEYVELMANQLLFRNGPQKLPNSVKLREIMFIT